jgi:fucose permease
LAAAGWSFKNYEKEETTKMVQDQMNSPNEKETTVINRRTIFFRALKTRTTIMGALFIFMYQGGEVSESGWFISYLVSTRQ